MNLSKIFKVVKSRTRVIFCYNQIALTIAYNLAKADSLKFKHTIFYAKDRCDIEAFKDYQITAVEYNFIHFIHFFIKSFFCKAI